VAKMALHKTNLVALGTCRPAKLLLEAVKGDAASQRGVRMALTADTAPRETAVEICKRFVWIRRRLRFLSAQAQRRVKFSPLSTIALATRTSSGQAVSRYPAARRPLRGRSRRR
jgi:hypothetical protein